MPKTKKSVKRKPSGTLQTILVSKTRIIDTVTKARRLVKDTVLSATTEKVDEKANTYRFRQLPPGRFVPGKYKTQLIVRSSANVYLVYGTLKPKKKAKK